MYSVNFIRILDLYHIFDNHVTYPLQSLFPRDGEVGLAVEVDDGEELVQRVGVGRAEALHHLQRLLLVSLQATSVLGAFPFPFRILLIDILS